MSRIEAILIIEKLEAAKSTYLSAVANIEDNDLDDETGKHAASLIQETQIQSEIALEQI